MTAHARSFALALTLAAVLLAGTACSGDTKPEASAEDTLAAAKKNLDDTSGVTLGLSTPQLPSGVTGLLKADGVATHDPAFKGSIKVAASGITADASVVAVDGVVYAKLPFTSRFVKIDPADYGAPDPAALIDPDTGVSSWLTAATGLEEGNQVRDGGDVLTSYHGKLPGSAVVAVIPSADASGDFDATFTLDGDGRLRSASVTGVFYKGKPSLTYVVTITEYATEKDISAP